ncbi:MAG: aldo/keto reductase [Casimicrobiaceae bacterium]
MNYVRIGDSDVRISTIALGGHEYLPDGRSRGFNEDLSKAITPGYLFPDFGGEQRKGVLRKAFDLGINLFDVTLDSEKEALGRNLAELSPPYDVYVQTRPEGMVYGYDPGNRKMTEGSLLRAEVQRMLRLLKRDRIDFLNLGILADAIERDPDFLATLGHNIEMLRNEGMIRFACADTFSGEATYLAQIDCGGFAALNVNFNLADDAALRAVIPAASRAGMTVIVREAFMKGALFRLGSEAGIADPRLLARVAVKWVYSQAGVDAVIVGAGNAEQLQENASVTNDPALSEPERSVLERLATSEAFGRLRTTKRADFLGTARS